MASEGREERSSGERRSGTAAGGRATGTPEDAGRIDLVGAAAVALAALQFGAVVVLGKIVTDGGLPVPSFLAMRFGLAAVLLAGLLTATGSPLVAARGEGWRLALLGMAGYAVESWCFFMGLRHGGPAAVTLLFFTYPVMVTVLAAALGKGLPGTLVLSALAAAVVGAALVVLGSGGLDISTLGVFFALASAFTFTLYLTGADAVLKRTNSVTGAMWVSGAAAVALAGYALATGQGRVPHGSHQWVPVVAVALFTAGAFGCLFAGLRRLGAVRTSIVAASEPLVAAALSVTFLGERLYAGTVAGGILILAGAVAASEARQDARGEPSLP